MIHRVHTKFMTCKPKGFFVPELRLRRHVVQITGCLWNLNTFRLCPGFDQDRVNFHRNPGRSTARKADPTWPNRAGYSIPCAVMLGSGEGELGGGTHSRLGSAGTSPVWENGSVGRAVCVVFSPYLYRCCCCSLCLLFC